MVITSPSNTIHVDKKNETFTFAGFDELSESPGLRFSFSKLDLTGILTDLSLPTI